MKIPTHVPLRVDFAGGWLDVPKFASDSGFIVNCAISPLVSLKDWPYKQNSGLGGSAAWSLLNGKNAVATELESGAGWQDPAVIKATGLCVWKSGPLPQLISQRTGKMLAGKMALYWTGQTHRTSELVDVQRNYNEIVEASRTAKIAAQASNQELLWDAVHQTYQIQRKEGMKKLPMIWPSQCRKYCGSGWGGYALYIFETQDQRDSRCQIWSGLTPIEPYFQQ